jgi:hypothetical protein
MPCTYRVLVSASWSMVSVPGVRVMEFAMVVMAASDSTRSGTAITSGWMGSEGDSTR